MDTPPAQLRLAVVADDLSGAAECAARANLRVSRSMVVLHCSRSLPPEASVVTVDTDSRSAAPADAATRARAAAGAVKHVPVVVKKIDSLLRGHLAAEVTAMADALGRVPVFAVTNPNLLRTVRDGVLHVDGTPLHDTDLWRVEPEPAPLSVAHALHPLTTTLVSQSTVSAGTSAVTRALRDVTATGRIPVCDAASDADLDTIRDAALECFRAVLLVGSAALVDSVVRGLSIDHVQGAPSRRLPRLDSLLMVLGTRSAGLPAQLDGIRDISAHVEVVTPAGLLENGDAVARRLAGLPTQGLVVVVLDPDSPSDPTLSGSLVAALADAVSACARSFDGVFLSGGETARAVLDRLGVTELDVVGETEVGTVVSTELLRTEGGETPDAPLVVVTRPGSYGGADSLRRCATALLGPAATRVAAQSPQPTPNRHAHHLEENL